MDTDLARCIIDGVCFYNKLNVNASSNLIYEYVNTHYHITFTRTYIERQINKLWKKGILLRYISDTFQLADPKTIVKNRNESP